MSTLGGAYPHRPNLVWIGAVGRVLSAVGLALAVGSAILAALVTGSSTGAAIALAVATVVLLVRGAASDASSRRRAGALGLVTIPALAVAMVACWGGLPGWAGVVAAGLAAASAALAAPALCALAATGAEIRTPATPRMRFVLGVGSPWAATARRAGRVLLPLSAALASATVGVTVLTGEWMVVVPLAALAVTAGYLTVAVVKLSRAVGPERAAEAAARILAAAVIGGLAAAIASATLPGSVAPVVLVTLTAVLALPAAFRPATATGRRLQPGTAPYRRAIQGFERSAHPRPDRAYVAATVADVQSAVADAASSGLGVIANSTGHAAVSLPDLAGVALIRVRLREPVTIDPVARTVRIPAGTSWGDVVQALAPTGLMAPHGSSALVGAMGYLLRGGLSFYGRTSGVAANSIESIEIVTADGALHLVDRSHDPQLFWALRGGGGGFGVVTAITVRLFPITALVTGTAFWSIEIAADLLAAWSTWHRSAPKEASTTFRIVRLTGLPGIPRSIAGRPVVNMDGVVHSRQTGDAEGRVAAVTHELLGPLRALGTPLLDTWRAGGVLDVPWTHMDPALPLPTIADHQLIDHLDDAGQRAFLDIALRPQSTLATIELRQLGGAFDDAPSDGGALADLRGATSLFATGLKTRASRAPIIENELDALRTAMAPWGTGFTAPNYAEDRRRPQRSFPEAVARDVDVQRARIDPAGVFAQDVAVGAVPLQAEDDRTA
ncbi:MAG TPA: FAD-dependent oxidoreductase [Microbacterium sp.]|uniref:FAD-binding oxidoreductase n=1 Tax=Microbacterium sp. TaxID=51671 RepID=UPI002B790655|nr:FAD-dependent oxidoreductase [Microbacterium sp.]HWI31461.1 FAD-dependent oxidoreductase [Microbacterium sp.]